MSNVIIPNQAVNYGVIVMPVKDAPLFWAATSVRHLPPGENAGNHHVYIDVYGENGESLRGSHTVYVAWGWEGQRGDEPSEPKSLEKPEGEHMTNIPMDWGQKVWCEVVSADGFPSDRVMGMHINHPREGDGAFEGHHSFAVEFRLTRGGVEPVVPVGPAVASLKEIRIKLLDLKDLIDELLEYVGRG